MNRALLASAPLFLLTGCFEEDAGDLICLACDDDGDGFSLAEEQAAGTNPDNEYSRPYEGGYNVGFCDTPYDEDAAGPTGMATMLYQGETYEREAYALGDILENFTLIDQHGEEVDIYSFCGKHIVFAVGAGWCGPCRSVAQTLQAEQDVWRDSNVQFIEIISQDDNGQPPSEEFLKGWHDQYGFTDIPVLGLSAESQGLSQLLDRDGYIPSIWQADATGTIVSADAGDSNPGNYIQAEASAE